MCLIVLVPFGPVFDCGASTPHIYSHRATVEREMTKIYVSKGTAGEQAGYVLNVYTSCDHGCKYCYTKQGVFRHLSAQPVVPRTRFKDVARQLRERRIDSRTRMDQETPILLSLMSDPYNRKELSYGHTRDVLTLLLERGARVSVLTKGGRRCLRDLDLLCAHHDRVAVGATLTFITPSDSRRWEPHAALPRERIDALRILHNNGIQTWASIEPVLDPEQSLRVIEEAAEWVDAFRIGKLNHGDALDRLYDKELPVSLTEIENSVDWGQFGRDAIALLEGLGKSYGINHGLRVAMRHPLKPGSKLTGTRVNA